jgi:predicted dehydrogenase
MTEKKANAVSRRSFLGTSLLGIAGLTILPGLKGCSSPNNKINLGFIGLGQQAMNLLKGFISIEGVHVVAGCDVYGIKRQRFQKRVTEFYAKAGKKANPKIFENYKELLSQPDIDAVVIAIPDHYHALVAIEACKAGKDIYLEKPLTFTIKEGQKLIEAVRTNKRILGVGSQQRSDPNFQRAVNLVLEGKIGKIEKVNAYVGAPPKPYDLPEETLPPDLNWDMWLGPNPYLHYNNQLNPPISLDPPKDEQFWGGWRWYKECGGGFTTDWGAHMFDVAQWGLGMDKSGPVEIIPAGYKDTKFLTYNYANGVVMTEERFNGDTKGVKFWGTNGWIEVARGFFNASDEKLKPAATEAAGKYETKVSHQANLIESIRSRKDPTVPVETGHKSCTVCNLGNIAYELMRPVKWNPANESFGDDQEAQNFFHRKYRDGYSL